MSNSPGQTDGQKDRPTDYGSEAKRGTRADRQTDGQTEMTVQQLMRTTSVSLVRLGLGKHANLVEICSKRPPMTCASRPLRGLC